MSIVPRRMACGQSGIKRESLRPWGVMFRRSINGAGNIRINRKNYNKIAKSDIDF